MNYLCSIGEALIDFIPKQTGCELSEVSEFIRVCGGAPANVAAVVAKLGGKSKMITQLGEDAFGDFVENSLKEVGVDTSLILRTKKANTALAFVSLKKDGNRDFMFYRNPCADLLLDKESINPNFYKDTDIIHFCSVDLVNSPMKEAHRFVIEKAKENGLIISFDPNIRLPLWNDETECQKTVRDFIKYADIIKISDEELEFITGEKEIEKASKLLFSKGVKLILYSMGKHGARLISKKYDISESAIPVTPVDTTGAGDSIIGAFLYCILNDGFTDLESITDEKAREYLDFANLYATCSVTKSGAITSYSNMEEFKDWAKSIGKKL